MAADEMRMQLNRIWANQEAVGTWTTSTTDSIADLQEVVSLIHEEVTNESTGELANPRSI
jgi:hypothetical protein